MSGRFKRRLSGMRHGSMQAVLGASALFLGTDTTTKGAWNGVYGTKGYILAEPTTSGTASLPGGYSWSISGNSFFDWSGSYIHPGAEPQLPSSSSTYTTLWYSGTSLTLSITQTSFAKYNLSVYSVDAPAQGRTVSFTIKDSAGNVLDPARQFTLSSLGVWYRWQIIGSIQIVLAYVSGAGTNAVMQGLCLD